MLMSDQEQERLIYDTYIAKYIFLCLPFLNNFLVPFPIK
jgi:hypothetical protein